MTDSRIVVIGGGAIGLSVAYHLGRRGADEVLVLERNELTSGTSWHAAGIIGPLRATIAATRIASRAAECFAEIEAETGQATGYQRTGGGWLAQSVSRLRELTSIANVGEHLGFGVTLLSGAELQERFPLMAVDDLRGGLWLEEDGQANPVDVCNAYAMGARRYGVQIEQNATVVAIESPGRRMAAVILEDGRRIRCKTIVNCAGIWSPAIGAMVGEPVPVQAVSHMYVVTSPISGLPSPCPIIRDQDSRIYFKGDASRLVVGAFEPNARPLDIREPSLSTPYVEFGEDWDQFEAFLQAGIRRVPVLEETGIRHFMNGPEGFTPDTRPLFGRVPGLEGYYIAAGMNSLGIVSSAGIGEAMADCILDGKPAFDLWEIDNARLDRHAAAPAGMRDRMREAVSNQFDMHWPGKQPVSARTVRRTVLHDRLAGEGAVFGQVAGWERPLWFAREQGEARIDYSYDAQPWWPIVAREAEAMANRVALLDLSPFTKIDVTGPDALDTMQRLCAGNADLPEGRLAYTQMLNGQGGIEADVTISRLGEDWWRVVSGAATRRKDLDWVQRHASERTGVFDATSAEAVIGVSGPQSRELLQLLGDGDLGPDALPFGHVKETDMAMAWVRVARASYSGELGFEISCATEVAAHIHEQIMVAGAEFGLAHAGMYCLDGCRLEKGFVHWSHDVTADVTPLEAGLGAFIDWSKADHFIGGQALLEQRRQGVRHLLVLLEVPFSGTPPLLLPDQPVLRDGEAAGMTTSAGLGPRTGRALALARLRCEPGQSRAELAALGDFEIAGAGGRHPARILVGPAYDPVGRRFRG